VSRRILSAFLALTLIAGFAAVTKADVTGSFDIHFQMIPEGLQTEAVEFYFDIQANLQVNVTLSGLTIGTDIGFGTTGIEFAIITLDTSLGALTVNDTFVFAPPFACGLEAEGNGSNTAEWSGQCPGQYVTTIGEVGFVKKRIELELNIAGITINNLALFEDVDFPDIQGGSNHEHDHFTDGDVYYVTTWNNDVDDATPTFGFGDVITLSGQTVSGITVTGRTAFCADDRNYIKKRNWAWEVNKACTATLGGAIEEIEGGAKTGFFFEEEYLGISGVNLGGIDLSMDIFFWPLLPLYASISGSFDVLDLASVEFALTSTNITNLTLDEISAVVVTGNLILILTDENGDLDFDEITAIFSGVLNPNQNPADFTAIVVNDGSGITYLELDLGITRGILAFDVATWFVGGGTLAWGGTNFAMSVDYGNGFAIEADMTFSQIGLLDLGMNVGITF
jgi:hypothetical protein